MVLFVDYKHLFLYFCCNRTIQYRLHCVAEQLNSISYAQH